MKRIKTTPLATSLMPLNLLNACAYKTQFCSAFQKKNSASLSKDLCLSRDLPIPRDFLSAPHFETTSHILTNYRNF